MRILIVDDEEKIANGLKCIIKQNLSIPHKIDLCSSADEALRLSLLSRPDVVITDIVMPGMDGLTMVQQLRQQDPAPAVIIISGYDQFSYVRAALRYGVKDYLLKPVDSEQLICQLNRIYA